MIQLVAQPEVQGQAGRDFPVILKKEMLVRHRFDAEGVSRKRTPALEGSTQQEVSERIARVCPTEGEVAAAARRVGGAGLVPAQQDTGLKVMRAADPGEIVVDLVLVVAEFDRAEGVRIEAEITGESEAGESRKVAALLGKAANAGKHRVIRSQSLGCVVEARADIVKPELVDDRAGPNKCVSTKPQRCFRTLSVTPPLASNCPGAYVCA